MGLNVDASSSVCPTVEGLVELPPVHGLSCRPDAFHAAHVIPGHSLCNWLRVLVSLLVKPDLQNRSRETYLLNISVLKANVCPQLPTVSVRIWIACLR